MKALLLILITLIACTKAKKEVPVRAQSLVFGGSYCSDASQCASGICKFGMCAGFVIASRPAERLQIANRIRTFIRQRRTSSQEVFKLAYGLLKTEKGSDQQVRGRAAELLGVVGTPEACQELSSCVKKETDPLRFHCAVGLALCHSPEGARVLESYTTKKEPLSSLARFYISLAKEAR